MFVTFIKYLVSSGLSFLIDIGLYAFLIRILAKVSFSSILFASILARILSSTFNYYVNRELVFSKRTKNSFSKYFALVISQISLSALLVYLIHLSVPIGNTALFKVAADGMLFFLSYFIQKNYIFKR